MEGLQGKLNTKKLEVALYKKDGATFYIIIYARSLCDAS